MMPHYQVREQYHSKPKTHRRAYYYIRVQTAQEEKQHYAMERSHRMNAVRNLWFDMKVIYFWSFWQQIKTLNIRLHNTDLNRFYVILTSNFSLHQIWLNEWIIRTHLKLSVLVRTMHLNTVYTFSGPCCWILIIGRRLWSHITGISNKGNNTRNIRRWKCNSPGCCSFLNNFNRKQWISNRNFINDSRFTNRKYQYSRLVLTWCCLTQSGFDQRSVAPKLIVHLLT